MKKIYINPFWGYQKDLNRIGKLKEDARTSYDAAEKIEKLLKVEYVELYKLIDHSICSVIHTEYTTPEGFNAIRLYGVDEHGLIVREIENDDLMKLERCEVYLRDEFGNRELIHTGNAYSAEIDPAKDYEALIPYLDGYVRVGACEDGEWRIRT